MSKPTDPDPNSPLTSAEQQTYERLCEIIKNGPRTPEAIGEPLWTIKRQRLYRGVVGDFAACCDVCLRIEPDEGMKLIADWEAMTGHTVSVTEPPRQSAPKSDALPDLRPDDDLPKRSGPITGLTRSQAALLSEVYKLHDEVLGAAKMSLTKAIRIGEILAGFQKTVGHGNWLRWLEDNVPFTDRTARNYIRLFEHQSELKSETISDLTAAYRLLAEPKDATEGQSTAGTTGTTETTEANGATDDNQSTGETTDEKESTKPTGGRPARKGKTKPAKTKSDKNAAQKSATKKGQRTKFKEMRKAVPEDWVKKVDQHIETLVGELTKDCQNEPARMLAVVDALCKWAAKIEAAIRENSTLAV